MTDIQDLIGIMRKCYAYALLGGRDYDDAIEMARKASERLIDVLEEATNE